MSHDIKIPAVGESIQEVEIGQWLIEEGDWVKKGQNLVEIETDKASLDLPAPASGVVGKILKRQGEPAEVGEVIARLEESEKPKPGSEEPSAKRRPRSDAVPHETEPAKSLPEESHDKRKKRPAEKSAPQPAARRQSAEPSRRSPDEEAKPAREAPERHNGPRVMPAARRLLEEHDLAAEAVDASGPGGRLLKEDVVRHLREHEGETDDGATDERGPETAEDTAEDNAEEVAKPALDTSTAGIAPDALREEEVVPMSLLRRRIARRLVEAQHTAALLTTFNEIDMSRVNELRRRFREPFQQKYGIKLGLMSFFVKAAIEALTEYPAANAEIRATEKGADEIVYHNYYDIGFAVGGGKGLVVPVLRNAERMSFAQIEQAIDNLACRARDNQLQPEELAGGTFTITNGGVYGSLLSTPIINPPQCAILGLHAIQDRPVAEGGQVVVRPMMYVALTYDHRLIDGREAVGFLRRIKEIVEDPPRMLLEV